MVGSRESAHETMEKIKPGRITFYKIWEGLDTWRKIKEKLDKGRELKWENMRCQIKAQTKHKGEAKQARKEQCTKGVAEMAVRQAVRD